MGQWPMRNNYLEEKIMMYMADFVSFLLVPSVVLGYYYSGWGRYFWLIFLPFTLICWYWGKVKPLTPLNKNMTWGILILSGCLLMSAFIVGDWADIRKTGRYLSCVIPFFIAFYLEQNYKTQKPLLLGAIVSLTVVCLYGVFMWQASNQPVMLSFFHQHNSLGMVLEILMPATLVYIFKSQKSIIRIFFTLLLILTLGCLYLSDSRGAVMGITMGMALAFVIFAISSKKKNWKILLAAASLSVVVTAGGLAAISYINHARGNDTAGERVIMLESSYKMWKDHKLAGVGITNWKTNYYGKYRPAGQREKGMAMPHNMIAFYGSTAGVIGLIGYAGYLFFTFKGLMKGLRKDKSKLFYAAGLIMFIAYFVHGMVDGTLTDERMIRVYFALSGAYAASYVD